MTADEMPKVYMTDEQWAWIQENDRQRSADAFATGQKQRETLDLLCSVMTRKPEVDQDAPTLRDHFASAALTGLVAGYWVNSDMSGLGPNDFSAAAFEQADAMLAARATDTQK